MSRRVSLPGADELFRTTGGMALQSSSPRRPVNGEARIPGPAGESDPAAPAAPSAERDGSAAAEHSTAAAETTESRSRTDGAEAAAGRRPQEARPMTAPVAPAGQQRRRGGGRGPTGAPPGVSGTTRRSRSMSRPRS